MTHAIQSPLAPAGAGEDGGGRLQGEVEVSAFFGSHHEATVRAGEALLRVRTAQALAPGARVTVAWGAEAGIAYPDDAL